MAEASFLAAFLGGVFTLLSPCSALLLPAFFAYAFGSKAELVGKTGIFYLGLATTLVPLGAGASAVSQLFYGQRGTLILVGGVLIIALGVLQLLGKGFAIGPLQRLQGRVSGDSGWGVYALGAVYGFAGFCSGPILGAILTLAASSGQIFTGSALLAVYALGMAAPLFLMAALWDRFGLGRRRWLRGREVSLGPLRVHTTNLFSGLMFIALGVVFIAYEGTSALSGVYEANGATNIAYSLERWAETISGGTAGVVLAVLLLLLAAFIAYGYFRGRRRNDDPAGEEQNISEREAEHSRR